MKFAGKCFIPIEYNGPKELFGRNWLKKMPLDWKVMHQVASSPSESSNNFESILEKYPLLFKDSLGTFQGVEAKIYVDAEATPLYRKARPVPCVLTKRIEEELERLE